MTWWHYLVIGLFGAALGLIPTGLTWFRSRGTAQESAALAKRIVELLPGASLSWVDRGGGTWYFKVPVRGASSTQCVPVRVTGMSPALRRIGMLWSHRLEVRAAAQREFMSRAARRPE